MTDKIIHLIASEDSRNPMTDEEIAETLGIFRETVTNIRKEAATCRNLQQVHWLQVAFCKSNHLPFFIDFFTSNMRISPVFGRVLISTSFPRAKISIMIFISLSFMFLFYHILRIYLSPHFQKSGRFPRRLCLHHLPQFINITRYGFPFFSAVRVSAHIPQLFC